MALFDSSVFPGDLQPATCIVQDRQVTLAVVDVKCVFEWSLFHPRVLCKGKQNVSIEKTIVRSIHSRAFRLSTKGVMRVSLRHEYMKYHLQTGFLSRWS